MGDFFGFRRMMTPVLIHLLFWIVALSSIAFGVGILIGQVTVESIRAALPATFQESQYDRYFGPNSQTYLGLFFILLFPILFRWCCEVFMVPFRINATLTDIRNLLKEQREAGSAAPLRRL